MRLFILLNILMTIQAEFRFLNWEVFELNEDFIALDYATTTDGYLFSINASSVRVIDSAIVSFSILSKPSKFQKLPFQVKFKLYGKDSKNQFRELYKNFPEVDWCQVMKSSSKFSANIFAKATVMFCKRLIPEFIRACPFPPINLYRANQSLPFQFQVMIPSGIYRLIVLLRNKSKDVLLNASGIWEVS